MALIDKASLLMVPSTYEAGKLYNVLPSGNRAPDSTDQNSGYDQTRADFDFDRGSNAAATRVNAAGLIEKYRENVLTESNNFSDSDWVKADTSVTSGQADKDGGTSAWLLSITAAGGFQTLRQTKSVSGVNTISIYAKAGALDWMRISNGVSTTYFDIANGAIETDNSIGASIESAGNGFFRCSIPFNGAGSYVYIYPATGNGNVSQSTGNIYIQNAQLETGLVATTYLNSGATTAKAGVLVDQPRINYDANGNNGALLLEPQRANGFAHSEYFGSWNLSGGTLTANSTTSPEGLKNAYLYTEDTGTNYHRFAITASATNSNKVFTVYAKLAIGAVNKFLTVDNGPTAWFDLENGTIGSTQGSVVISMESVGNGWFRCIYHNPASSNGGLFIGIAPSNNGLGNHTGSGQPAFYAFGAQCEDNVTYPTSYIPTYGTAQTRAADSCLLNNSSALPTAYPFTLYSESIIKSIGQEYLLSFLNTSDNVSYAAIIISSGVPNLNARSSSSDISLASPDSVSEGSVKIVGVFESSTLKLFVNGALKATVSNTTTFQSGWNDLLIGQLRTTTDTGDRTSNKQAIVFPTALTNAECVTLTTL